jgi:L-alanine-DL-glutamate epimerase-like enolase superfamily enzyme
MLTVRDTLGKEDPVPPDNIEAMARVTHSIGIPVCTGENLYGRQGFRRLIEEQACSAVHIDVPKSGGLLGSKKISDLADLYYIWTACHNSASPIGTIASCHAASAMRDFRIDELANWSTGGRISSCMKVRSGRTATSRLKTSRAMA